FGPAARQSARRTDEDGSPAAVESYSPKNRGREPMKLRLLAAALPLLLATPAMADDPVPSAKDYPAPPAGWKVARTAWGDPDLRGMWPVDYLAATPRERPVDVGTRTEWTEEEYKERFGQAQQRQG